MADNFIDVMGVLNMTPTIPDGWELVMLGEESRRPTTLVRVAKTKVEVTLASEEDFDRFLEIIKESDEKLSAIPDNKVGYEWTLVMRQGLTIRFGVAWYNRKLFDNRKDAYLSEQHASLFENFHITAKDLKVVHEILE